MENKIIDITLLQLISAYVFILILLVIVKLRKIPREKEIIIATFRMTLQLTIVGYILIYVFDHANPFFTIVIILIMEGFAIFNVYQRVKNSLGYDLKKAVAISLASGTLIALIYFNFVVIHFSPWYNPRYFIPIAGMVIGNAMTGVTLGANALTESMTSKRAHVEQALMLGATPKQATHDVIKHTFDNAILPTINNMVGMGIVFLPGMMTGVILSGVSPVLAVKYQLAIMLGITGSVSLSVIIFVQLGYKSFFNHRQQLKND
ncbi:ABC transporter permease [Tuberibacillus sp. Marseille-P3662]|uniref:ABC transporter permease n=1 Tax=Tuberibacillus sp. Marseille-P3662 TaxID=1965358 RepID=UPI000A1CA858|nr:iron export ABC transporter permease subunit FetB [Tuberibacillus sp. Marseille-P3662]